MADTKWPFYLYKYEMYLHNFMSSKSIHSEKILYMPFIPNKSIFTPSGTVFSKFIASELLSETLRNKRCHNDVISRDNDIKVSAVIRISTYTILCKLGGHSVSGFKVA